MPEAQSDSADTLYVGLPTDTEEVKLLTQEVNARLARHMDTCFHPTWLPGKVEKLEESVYEKGKKEQMEHTADFDQLMTRLRNSTEIE